MTRVKTYPQPLVRLSLPSTLIDVLGYDVFAKHTKISLRRNQCARNRKCPKCGSRQTSFRSTTHDMRCTKCRMVFPALKRFG